jgi:tetratricopeptide (TPR) repeat protein
MTGEPIPRVLEALLEAWRDSSHNRPRLVWLEGAAGVGKSHRLRALAASVQGPLVLNTACAGWLGAALRAFHRRLEGERDRAFLQAARSMAGELTWAQVAHAPALNDQHALWTAVAQAFERLARRSGGLLLLLEDAHEASPDDVGALRVLYRRALLGKAPIMVVLSSRPAAQDVLEGFEQDATIAAGARPERVSLSNLDVDGVEALLREHLHAQFLPDGLAAWLQARSEGHPLHTLELLRFLCDGGALRQAGTVWVFRAPSGKAVPRRLEGVLKARLLPVQADVHAWSGMAALAVMDRAVTVHEWAAMTGQSADRVLELANRLEHRGLVHERLEFGETLFGIAHPLYAPLVRAQLAAVEVQRLHERALEVCVDVSERARHARACDHPSAAALSRAALEDAERRFAHTEVVSHAEHVLTVQPDDIEVVLALSRALFVLGDTERALQVSQRVQTVEASPAQTAAQCALLEVRFHILMRLGRYFDALEAAVLAQRSPDHAATARLNEALALMHLERFADAHRVIDALLAEYPEPSARHGKALDILSDVVYSQGDLRGSLEIGSKAADMLREFGDLRSLAITLSNLGGCCGHFGLWERGQKLLEEAIALFVARGAFQHVMFARNNLAFLMVESGEYAQARPLLLRVCEQAHGAKETRVEAAALTSLSDLEWQSDNLELAWQYLEAASALEQRESADLVDRAHLQALRGDVAGALVLVDAPQTKFHVEKAGKRARIALIAGQFERALAFVREAQTADDHATRSALLKLLQGYAHHGLGDRVQALRGFGEAQALAEAGGHGVIRAEAALALALLEGRTDAHAALHTLESLDARGHIRRVRASLEAAWALIGEARTHRTVSSRSLLLTLGAFGVEHDGHVTALRDSKARDLLAHLLVAYLREDGPGVRRTRLIDAIWPESGDTDALEANFRVTLKRLREKLGDAASVHSQDGIYALRDLNADVTQFLTALERLDFEAALGWYKGEFLPDVDIEDADLVRSQLWQRFRDTALRSSLEQPAALAADLLEKLHHLDPLDTTVLERLTVALHAVNDPQRLERTLSRARTVLAREIGEVPMAR